MFWRSMFYHLVIATQRITTQSRFQRINYLFSCKTVSFHSNVFILLEQKRCHQCHVKFCSFGSGLSGCTDAGWYECEYRRDKWRRWDVVDCERQKWRTDRSGRRDLLWLCNHACSAGRSGIALLEAADMNRPNCNQDNIPLSATYSASSLYDDVIDAKLYAMLGQVPWFGRKAPDAGLSSTIVHETGRFLVISGWRGPICSVGANSLIGMKASWWCNMACCEWRRAVRSH